jgi:hypothetical protein
MRNNGNRRGIVWVVCGGAVLLICVLLLRVLQHQAPLEPVLVLHRPVTHPVSLRDRVQGSIPRTLGWAQRLADRLFGTRKPVNLNAAVFTAGEATVMQLEEFSRGLSAPVTSNGPAVWFLEAIDVKKLRALLETGGTNQVCYGRITTADGIGAGLFMGQTVIANGSTNQVGLQTSYFARVGQETTDLFAEVMLSEAVTNEWQGASSNESAVYIKTNADIAVRLQVPKGKGVFLLQTPVGRESERRAGFLLDPL